VRRRRGKRAGRVGTAHSQLMRPGSWPENGEHGRGKYSTLSAVNYLQGKRGKSVQLNCKRNGKVPMLKNETFCVFKRKREYEMKVTQERKISLATV
jgi:hypothetical protein